ncbi:CaiB/BaiF CoA-transferase family protein [Amycolatopsis sp. NPDC004079]|uniref:CaiB/BaiF CoA transferase family protein n=1 Tax=Amycolatopsis sp. NPDC004079 TaxID=3154549 RepID=UPI0033A5DF52
MDADEFYRHARTDRTGPLHGVRVLDVTKVWSGPMAACVLADLGAEVIRVEMPGNREGTLPPHIPGTSLSWFRETVHRNKRSVGLDLRVPEARPVFRKLVATADVVLENYKPGTLDAWGVGYAACREVRADLVFVSISGWGQYGPDADRAGYDPITQAASGWMSLNGDADGGPVRAPTFLADDLAGLHGALGALAALRHRDSTGEGQHVDVSMLDSLLFQSSGFLTLGATGATPRRWGNETDFAVPAGLFRCADTDIYLVITLNKHWRQFAEVIGRPELARAAGYATNEDRREHRDKVNAVVSEWCARHPARYVVDTLRAAGLIAERVRTFGEVAADAHVRARDMLVDTELCTGERAPLTGPAVKFSGTPTGVRSAAPRPGADTGEVLRGIGLSDREQDRLRERRAI